MGKTIKLNRKIRFLLFILFLNLTILFSQEKSLEIIQNFSKENYQKASNHKINYIGDAPFVMLSAYSTDLSLKEVISYRIKSKNHWSKWTKFKKPHDGEDVDRVVFDAVFIDTNFSEIEFKSSEVFNTNIVFRLYIPKFTKAIKQKNSIKEEIDDTNYSTAKSNCVQPSFQGRTDWCPDGTCIKPVGTPITPTHIVVHHSAGNTVSTDYAAVVKGYWDFHVNTRGWADIGYNWLIDPNGVLYEGRGDKIRGAHSACMNGTSTGICVIGEYSTHQPNNTMVTALEQMIAWDALDKDINILATSYNTSLGNTIANVSGHRTGKIENPSSNCTATVCPGNNMFNKLGSIRANAANACNSASYCEVKGNNSSYEWIDSVTVNGQTNTSGNDGGYGDYTNLTANLQANATYPISLTPGYQSTPYKENWKIWIDFNQDGDFEDAGEEIYNNPSVDIGTVTGSISIPFGLANGNYRMRIAMNWSSSNSNALNPCGTFAYGEVEDYMVNINGSNPGVAGMGDIEPAIIAYPNPVKDVLNIRLNSNITTIAVYAMNGLLVYQKKIDSESLYTIQTDLWESGLYMVILEGENKREVIKVIKM